MGAQCREEVAALKGLAQRVRAELEVSASRAYAQQIPLSWVGQYICQEAVEQVLQGAQAVLRELGLEDAKLLQIPAEELSPLWTKRLQASQTSSWRGAPEVVELQYATIRDVASAAYTAMKQQARNSHLLQFGPPPGVAELPALASLEKSKSLPIPFILEGNPATVQDKRYQRYMSHVAARRRRPGARSTWCHVPPDTARPDLYT